MLFFERVYSFSFQPIITLDFKLIFLILGTNTDYLVNSMWCHLDVIIRRVTLTSQPLTSETPGKK